MTPLPDLSALLRAREGELRVELGTASCFSSRVRTVRLLWTTEGGSVEDSRGSGRLASSAADVRELLTAIVGAARKREVHGEARSTTMHSARLAWIVIFDDGCIDEGELERSTSEMSPRQVESFLEDHPAFRAQVPAGAHCFIHALAALLDQRFVDPRLVDQSLGRDGPARGGGST